ncbi:MAG: phage integrase N-terminal SAM-like domain-containing protein, partial [Candidatus Nanoarchaeia archaeon]|nr:phage integrase N-terminal SAM-like domain-containing protein [Candidatus Nanoarchaeia archaeon]
MNERWEIHKYAKTLQWRMEGIKNCKHCSEINSKHLLEFHDYLLAEGLSIPRVEKYMCLLTRFDKETKGKNFLEMDKKDLISFLAWLETTSYSEWTKKGYKVALKKFYKWANNGELPKFVSWIKSSMKNEKKLLPQELLTPEEVIKLINSSTNPRDKAFIGMLYESGCRIGEILTIKLKHIDSDKYGLIIRVNGKTGVRRVRIISTSNLVTNWINNHPDKNSSDTYLWS